MGERRVMSSVVDLGRRLWLIVAWLAAGSCLAAACSSQQTPAPDAGPGASDVGAEVVIIGPPPDGSNCGIVRVTAISGTDPCTFTLPSMPPFPTDVRAQIDGATVPQSDVNGWRYGGPDGGNTQEIVFSGSYCDVVLKGAAAMTPPVSPAVTILFGCASGGPIP